MLNCEFDFGPVSGRAGALKSIEVVLSTRFLIDSVTATETTPATCCAEHANRQDANVADHAASGWLDSAGLLTEIIDLQIAGKPVIGFSGPTSEFCARRALPASVEIPTAATAVMRVRFLRDAVFVITAHGRSARLEVISARRAYEARRLQRVPMLRFEYHCSLPAWPPPTWLAQQLAKADPATQAWIFEAPAWAGTYRTAAIAWALPQLIRDGERKRLTSDRSCG